MKSQSVRKFGNRYGIWLALLSVAVTSAGCSAARRWRESFASPPDERMVQREAALSDFEKRRTEVQLKAAQERLAVGAVDDSRRLLESILQRQPSCRDATLMLAVLHADDDDLRAAEKVLVAGLRQNPEDAELHHTLGTILELDDRLPEAKAHFASACQLMPGNRIFRDSLEGLSDITAGQPLVAAAPKPKADKVAMRISDEK
jgi:Flp pilus assembly protein TadD